MSDGQLIEVFADQAWVPMLYRSTSARENVPSTPPATRTLLASAPAARWELAFQPEEMPARLADIAIFRHVHAPIDRPGPSGDV
jgi:hypothetical protein